MALGQQELGRAHVLADRAHVLIWRRGRPQLGLGAVEVHVLAHDDGVVAVGQRIARVDGREVAGVECGAAVVGLAPTVAAARTAMPSMAAVS
jgi:hypothetical protein